MNHLLLTLVLPIITVGIPYSVCAEPFSPREFSVPFRSFSDQRAKVVKRIAAGASDDAVVVLFLGSDQQIMDEARAGASDAKDRGYPVVGIPMLNPEAPRKY